MYSKVEAETNPFLAGLAAIQAAKECEIWPENMAAIDLFNTLSTQWIVGPGGVTGLNYIPLFSRMDRMKLSEQEYEWMFGDIRVIESEALKALNTKD